MPLNNKLPINHNILVTLTDNLPDMLWIKDLEGCYLFANKAICENLLMAKDTMEPIGKDDIFFAKREREKYPNDPTWHTFGELCADSDQVTIEKNQPIRFEEYGTVKGNMLYLEVHKAPFYNEEGDILGTVGSGRDITEMMMMKKKLEEQKKNLHHQAHHDPLTNLPNRLLFHDRLAQSLKGQMREQKTLAVLFIDLDYFKEVNDQFGHERGDAVLITIAQRMRINTRVTDTLARIGGDEFTLILNGFKEIKNIIKLLDSLLKLIEKPIIIKGISHELSASVGVSISDPQNPKTYNQMLKEADTAMYDVKKMGRGKFKIFE